VAAFVLLVTAAAAVLNARGDYLALRLSRAFVGAMLGFGVSLAAYALFWRWGGVGRVPEPAS
jgi:hypothetical protein